MEVIEEIRDCIQDLQDPSCLNNGDIIDKGSDIESAILVACLVIAKPRDPQKALFDAYEQVKIFRKEKNKLEEQRYLEYIKKHPKMQKSISFPENNSLIQQLVELDEEV